jgi:hypothetical protein
VDILRVRKDVMLCSVCVCVGEVDILRVRKVVMLCSVCGCVWL